MKNHDPEQPVHVAGALKGEELVRKGHEPGRDEKGAHGYRAARDSTSIDANGRKPIDPAMPEMPPP